MMIKHARGEFPVTDRFALFCPPDLLQMTHIALEQERQRWYNLANERSPWPLKDDELARLAQVTHVINVHNALNAFDDWTPGAFGLDHADRLHGNMRHHDCGCKVHVAFCHYGESPAVGHRIHTACHAHKHHNHPDKLIAHLRTEAEAAHKEARG